MAMIPLSSPSQAVITDASFIVAICAKEAATEAIALAEFHRYTGINSEFFAPGVLVSETLYVLCGKLTNGLLDAVGHAQAVTDLESLVGGILPPPSGEVSLIRRAEAIRAGYSCRRSADGLYIALAEQLARTRPTVLLTFDKELPKQAARCAPSVVVRLL